MGMKLYRRIRNFDVYEGKNPFKIFLRHIALKMWEYQDARDVEANFLDRKKTNIGKISFLKYLIMSLFYKTEG